MGYLFLGLMGIIQQYYSPDQNPPSDRDQLPPESPPARARLCHEAYSNKHYFAVKTREIDHWLFSQDRYEPSSPSYPKDGPHHRRSRTTSSTSESSCKPPDHSPTPSYQVKSQVPPRFAEPGMAESCSNLRLLGSKPHVVVPLVNRLVQDSLTSLAEQPIISDSKVAGTDCLTSGSYQTKVEATLVRRDHPPEYQGCSEAISYRQCTFEFPHSPWTTSDGIDNLHSRTGLGIWDFEGNYCFSRDFEGSAGPGILDQSVHTVFGFDGPPSPTRIDAAKNEDESLTLLAASETDEPPQRISGRGESGSIDWETNWFKHKPRRAHNVSEVTVPDTTFHAHAIDLLSTVSLTNDASDEEDSPYMAGRSFTHSHYSQLHAIQNFALRSCPDLHQCAEVSETPERPPIIQVGSSFVYLI